MKTPFFVSKLLIIVILCPAVVFLFQIPHLRLPTSNEWFFVLLSTFAQAGLSALFALFFGILGAFGLCAFTQPLPRKYNPLSFLSQTGLGQAILNPINVPTKTGCQTKHVVELLCLLPAFLPPLVTVLAYINVSEWFFRFPFSWSAVLSVHVLMNIGLSAVFISRLWSHHTGDLSAYAFLHGATKWLFLKKLLFFELRKDMILLFLLVFSFCWTSFSVPLLVGGVSGQTIEVFIAEKLKVPEAWPEAMALFALQTVFLLTFFLFLYGKERPKITQEEEQKLYLLPCWPWVIFPLFSPFLILSGLVAPLMRTFTNRVWADIWLIKVDIISAYLQSLLVGLGVGLATFAGLSIVAYCLRDLFLRHFLLAYTSASTAFMGFAFLLLGTDSLGAVWLKWVFGLSLLFLPALYRLRGEQVLARLKEQDQVAQLMGASPKMIFRKIIHPQCQKAFWFLSGVASFWAIGDFAYSSIVAGDQSHLALLIQELLASYRLELATLLIWLLICTGTFCFLILAIGIPEQKFFRSQK